MKLIEINNLTKQLPRIFSINLTLKKRMNYLLNLTKSMLNKI